MFRLFRPLFSRLFMWVTEALDRSVGWHRLSLPLGILTLIGLRERLRRRNLYDTSSASPTSQHDASSAKRPVPEEEYYLTARTADGRFNDLDNPTMGSAGTRFGRNVPLQYTYPDNEWATLNEPNPRKVSRELLTRDTFKPA